MKQQLLLLEDVKGLGRSGDVVTAKSGYIRNFLLPEKKAVVADKHTLKMQVRLKQEREKKAAVERKEAATQATQLAQLTVSIEVKIDPDGKMYGSVTSVDIARLLQKEGYKIDRKNIILAHPIKNLGIHSINLKLKEAIDAQFKLEVKPEGNSLSFQQETKEESME